MAGNCVRGVEIGFRELALHAKTRKGCKSNGSLIGFQMLAGETPTIPFALGRVYAYRLLVLTGNACFPQQQEDRVWSRCRANPELIRAYIDHTRDDMLEQKLCKQLLKFQSRSYGTCSSGQPAHIPSTIVLSFARISV